MFSSSIHHDILSYIFNPGKKKSIVEIVYKVYKPTIGLDMALLLWNVYKNTNKYLTLIVNHF